MFCISTPLRYVIQKRAVSHIKDLKEKKKFYVEKIERFTLHAPKVTNRIIRYLHTYIYVYTKAEFFVYRSIHLEHSCQLRKMEGVFLWILNVGIFFV